MKGLETTHSRILMPITGLSNRATVKINSNVLTIRLFFSAPPPEVVINTIQTLDGTPSYLFKIKLSYLHISEKYI